ncbi:hypothetical protein BJV82DRAFT_625678 [Fennellomyces sp. T-0311]|nr:hypothetical protein BJV82DRAFT_625678 [Fennellomyces sp. T-0311]
MSENGLQLNCTLDEAQKAIYAAIDEVSAELRELSLDLHDNPEISMKEYHASQVLSDYVEKKGFKVTRKVFGMETSFRAEFSDGSNGRRIGFCSEYDALPGLGHACGHNLIAICGVAGALAVKSLIEKKLASGKVVLFGTPSEELLSGKIIMLNHGAFRDDVDVCLMLHPSNGHANYVSLSALQDVHVEYRGKPAHAGGAPWNGVNALDAICQAWVSIGLLRQQLQGRDRVHGIITDGGKAPNIIPDYTAGHFYVRAGDAARVEELKEKVDNCFRAAALATGTEVTLKWRDIGTCKNIVQNSVMAETYAKYLKEFGHDVPSRQAQESAPAGASTDFGNVSHAMPSIHPMFKITVGDDMAFPHTAAFCDAARTENAHKEAITAAKCLSMVAAHVLLESSFYESSKQEFETVVPVNMR